MFNPEMGTAEPEEETPQQEQTISENTISPEEEQRRVEELEKWKQNSIKDDAEKLALTRQEVGEKFEEENLWEKKDYQKIFDNFVKEQKIQRGGFTDYSYSADKLADTLELSEFFEKDERLKDLIDKLGENNYLTKRRKREIVLENLAPLLEVVPIITNEMNDSAEVRENEAVEFLIEAGLCTTKGCGTKTVDWKKVINMRGEELRIEIQKQLQEDEKQITEIAKRHGGKEAEVIEGWMSVNEDKKEDQTQNINITEGAEKSRKEGLFRRLFGDRK